ncbi:DNA methyltransferase family protein [Agrobacterium pusense]|uniref:hypothetical protein n=1 Tax=Agrobacterium pusense TaxID=648995 RepID=UPI00384F9B61
MTFETFVDGAVRTARMIDRDAEITLAHPLLNGVPYSTFRREVGIDLRRQTGAFFSSDAMASALVGQIADTIDEAALVLDPTCGIGDLLLARATSLPVLASLSETLAAWGQRLAGFDIQEDLVRLCKARLCMLARARGNFSDEVDPLSMFPLIVTLDMFESAASELLIRADAVLFNPPFGKTVWPEKLHWASGEINAAAIFLDRLTTAVRPDVPIVAVLPEVLRCGSRYERFRSMIAARGYSGTFAVCGRFDTWTDVDVFTTLLTRERPGATLWSERLAAAESTVEGLYEIRVGTVVPHRDSQTGASRAYICAKTTPAWATDFTPVVRRRYAGKVFFPPFVAIRRTSSPSDKMRAVATVVIGDEAVAVENHLLVAIPRDGSTASCEALATMLRMPAINDRLNDLMRCRHLTTGAIKGLPWILPHE